MPTIKHRVNITLPEELDKIMLILAQRDHQPVAAKATELLKIALDLEEDTHLENIIEQRAKSTAKFVSHKKAWL